MLPYAPRLEYSLVYSAFKLAGNTNLHAPLMGEVPGPLSGKRRKSLAKQHYENYVSQPDNDEPFVVLKTKEERNRIWERWEE
jgi:hypothetical protein